MGITQRIIIVCSIILVLAALGAICLGITRNNICEINDVDEYYQQIPEIKDKLNLSLFPDTLPNSAIAEYFYYQYFSSKEIYLELTFENVNELRQFVNLQIQENDDKLTKRTNPYNADFIEYFSASVGARSGRTDNDDVFNYIEYYNKSHIGAFFYSMNVSENASKVVITYISGKFEIKRHIPKYLCFYNVHIDETLHDYVKLSDAE